MMKSSSKVWVDNPVHNRVIFPDRGQPQTLPLLEKVCDTSGLTVSVGFHLAEERGKMFPQHVKNPNNFTYRVSDF